MKSTVQDIKMEDAKKTQVECVEMKYTMQEIKNGINGRLEFVEENIRDCENMAIETKLKCIEEKT